MTWLNTFVSVLVAAVHCIAPLVSALLLASSQSVARGEDAAAAVATITLGAPAVVAVSPPEYGRDPAGRSWGFFQFPDLWRGNDGSLSVVVHVGADSVAGTHEPSQFFSSGDGGRSWQRTTADETDLTPEIISLPDGRQTAFGTGRWLYHQRQLLPDGEERWLDATAFGIEPVAGPYRDGYKVNEYLVYSFDDIPPARRHFPVACRESATAEWRRYEGTIAFPSLRLAALSRAMWWNDSGKEEWRELPRRLAVPMPQEVTILPDGTLLWPLASQHPAAEKLHTRVACLASEDAGRTWQVRGMIADGLDASWGYGFAEQSLARMPDGDLLCVMRTKASGELADTHHLAAARSTDGGRTWTQLPSLAEFSVTPHLVALSNGMVAVVYGRPGVHVKASADGGHSWGPSQPIVGPSEREILAQSPERWWKHRHDWSCSNTSIVVTGADRFLVAYSDFRHRDSEGRQCKAIEVREVVVAAP